MSRGAVLALDQGTTGSSAFVITADGRVAARAYSEFTQYFPRPGWVEHDAEEIWRVTLRVSRQALQRASLRVVALGITNQRETVVLWDRETLEPLHPAIVWQDRRTAALCRELKGAGHEPLVRRRTGLVVDPYFSALKVRWILDARPDLAARAEAGDIAAGTIDSWLIARLTAGAVHATDPTNASRTMLYDLDRGEYDERLMELTGVPRAILPEIRPSRGDFGCAVGNVLGDDVPITGVAGDQQAALYGQGCWHAGEGKCTYGTGAFLLVNTGARRVLAADGLLTTAACDAWGRPCLAVEGSILVAGAAIQWLRDELGVLDSAAESEALARALESNDGVYMVPAFTGLGAPHWASDARGCITGLTRGTTAGHLVRAALEAMAYGTDDLLALVRRDSGMVVNSLRVDGGAVRNDWLLEFLAGIVGIPVHRGTISEATALGAAGLAGLGAGVWDKPEDFGAAFAGGRTFTPSMDAREREVLVQGWRRAVRATLAQVEATT